MLVWRLEDNRGLGVYQHCCCDGRVNPKRPSPDVDPKLAPKWNKLAIRDKYFFGFSKKKDAYVWFDNLEERRGISEAGVYLKAFEVDDDHVIIGKTQAVFRKDKAREVVDRRTHFSSRRLVKNVSKTADGYGK